ncbi:hypothetical protein GCM10027341_03240 [Spirosoma knui]
MDELHAPVLTVFQRIQNQAVENKNDKHGLATSECVIQSGIVVQAQVTPEPYNGQRFSHFVQWVIDRWPNEGFNPNV